MNDLVNVLVKAHPAVGWFALGEAKQIAEAIRLSVLAYRTDKSPANRAKVVEAARAAMTFLHGRATNESLPLSRAIREQLAALGEKI